MLRYTIDRARPGLVAFYDIWPGNEAGLFLQPRNPHGAGNGKGTSSWVRQQSENTHAIADPCLTLLNPKSLGFDD